jgi:hypothetical protein
MNMYEAMVEWYWHGKTKVQRDKRYTMCVVDGGMNMEQLLNVSDKGKLKYWEKNIIQCGRYMDEWGWSNGGMILTWENCCIWRKTLYNLCVRWRNEYGAMVEWYWHGKTVVFGEKHYTICVLDGGMCMEQWWNDTDKGILKYWEKIIILCEW